jgi:hypothetical protein
MKANSNNAVVRTRKGKRRESRLNPPQISGNVAITRTYRFTAATLGENIIQDGSLLAAAGGICTATNSSCAVLSSGYKIHSVEVWAPGITGVSTARVQWFTGLGGSKSGEAMDTTLSAAKPAHVYSRPPKGSNASFQGGTGTTVVLIIECPATAIIDIKMTHWLRDDAASVSRSVSAGTLGYLYWFPLDGPSANLLPVGLQTTN